MYYFAYGSNMSSRRLHRRIDATKIGNAFETTYIEPKLCNRDYQSPTDH
jgi:hypothetical protein